MPVFLPGTLSQEANKTQASGPDQRQVTRSNSGQAANAAKVRAARAAVLSANAATELATSPKGTPGEPEHPWMAAGRQLLELLGESRDATARTESLRPKRDAPWQEYDVPIDDSILAAKNPSHELTIRMLAVGLAERGLVLPRFDLEQLYYLVPWDKLPPREEVVHEVAVALESGHDTIWYRSNAVVIALRANEQRIIKLNRAHAEFQDQLKNSTYVQDALVSFYTAHVNAPLGLVNDALSLAWRGSNFAGITDSEAPQLPQIPYTGEFGEKYGDAMETGAKTGLLVVAGGPLGGALGQIGSKGGALLQGVSLGGAAIANLALQAARISMAVGATVDAGELAGTIAGLVYQASSGTPEEREKALSNIWEIAVYGAFEYIVGRRGATAKGSRGRQNRAQDGNPDARSREERGEAHADHPPSQESARSDGHETDVNEPPNAAETQNGQENTNAHEARREREPEAQQTEPERRNRSLGLSGAATRAIQKLENLKRDPVGDINSQPNHNHYSAARREAGGEVVMRRSDNRPYSHIGDLQQAADGLDNVRQVLAAEARSPRLTERGREVINKRHREVNKLSSRLRGFLGQLGHGSFPPYHQFPEGT